MSGDEAPTEAPRASGGEFDLRSCLFSEAVRSLALPLLPNVLELRSQFGPQARLHVVIADGQVVSWGISEFPVPDWPITETDTRLILPPGSAALMGFETLPEFRRRGLYLLLQHEMLRQRFNEGAQWAYIWCYEGNVASRRAIEKMGFMLVERHDRRNVLGFSRKRISSVRPAESR